MSEIRIPDLPALRVFDPKATRWAVIRGLVRTAFVVLGFLLVASLVVGIGVNVLANRLGRAEQMERLSMAYEVAHPGLTNSGGSGVFGGWTQRVQRRGVDADGRRRVVELKLGIFGNLSVGDRDERDALDDVLVEPAWSRVQTTRYVGTLPSGIVLDALVVLDEPVASDAVGAVVPAGLRTDFFGPALEEDRPWGGTGLSRPVCWVEGASLRAWAHQLRDRDDDNLAVLGLPSARTIQDLADADKVSAVYARGLTVAQVRALLADPRIASVSPVAVRFEVERPG